MSFVSFLSASNDSQLLRANSQPRVRRCMRLRVGLRFLIVAPTCTTQSPRPFVRLVRRKHVPLRPLSHCFRSTSICVYPTLGMAPNVLCHNWDSAEGLVTVQGTRLLVKEARLVRRVTNSYAEFLGGMPWQVNRITTYSPGRERLE